MLLARIAALALLSAVTAFGASPARAVTTSCQANATYDPDGPPSTISDVEDTTGSCTASIAQSPMFLGADGEAGVGFMQSRAEMTRLEGAIDDAYVFTRTSFGDRITVTSEGHSGIAFLHATLFLSGVIDLLGNGEAGVRLMLGSSDVVSETCRSPILLSCFGSTDPYPRFVSGFYEGELSVELSSAQDFTISLIAFAGYGGSLANDASVALSDFGGGGDVQFLGFDELTQSGAPIPFTIASQSGIDWTQPVPEPGAAVSAIGALLALASRARRR
jgi:hypothetical protein